MKRTTSVITEKSVGRPTKRLYKKRKSTVATLSRAVRQIQRSQESKWHDVSVASATAGQVEPLTNVPLGDDSISRDGRKITLTSLMIRIVAVGSNATGVYGFPRLVIVYDKVPNGVLPAATDIFTSAASTAFMNLNNRNRFKVLYDNMGGLGHNRDPYNISTLGTGGVFSTNFGIEDHVKIPRLETIFKDTGSGTTAGTTNGALYAVFLGSGADASTLDGKFRLRFLDS